MRRLVASVALTASAMFIVDVCFATEPPVTYAVGGDSITCAPDGWDDHQPEPDTYQRVGGYCGNGQTSIQVLAAVTPAPDADVAIVMVGTNDVRFGVPAATITANAIAIGEKLGSKHVIIAALPPSNLTDYGAASIDRAVQGAVTNRALAAAAAERGWLFVDPFTAQRRMDGKWQTGSAQADGVHPTANVATAVAMRLNEFMAIAMNGSPLTNQQNRSE